MIKFKINIQFVLYIQLIGLSLLHQTIKKTHTKTNNMKRHIDDFTKGQVCEAKFDNANSDSYMFIGANENTAIFLNNHANYTTWAVKELLKFSVDQILNDVEPTENEAIYDDLLFFIIDGCYPLSHRNGIANIII